MIGLKNKRYQQTSSSGKAQAAHNEAGAIEVTCRCVINNTNGTFLPTTVPTGRCLFHRLLKGCLVWKHCKLIDVNTFYSVSGKSLRMYTNEPIICLVSRIQLELCIHCAQFTNCRKFYVISSWKLDEHCVCSAHQKQTFINIAVD